MDKENKSNQNQLNQGFDNNKNTTEDERITQSQYKKTTQDEGGNFFDNFKEKSLMDETNTKSTSNRQKTRYTIQQKLEFIKEAEETSNYKVAEKYDVDVSTVRYWRDNKDKYQLSDNKYDRKMAPRILERTELEDAIYEKIIEFRNEGKPISTKLVMVFAIELNKTLERNLEALRSWIYRFMARNNFSFRKVTHKYKSSQIFHLREDVIRHLNQMIKINKEETYQLSNIFNMDEVPIYLASYGNYTWTRKGDQNVDVSMELNPKDRISCILTICSNGSKLPPYCIFKGKEGGRIEEELKKHKLIKEKEIFFSVNEKAWNTRTIMQDYLSKLFSTEQFISNNKDPILLIMDGFSAHKIGKEQEVDFYKPLNIDPYYIPSNSTHLLQPLDVAINKSFKSKLKEILLLIALKNQEMKTNEVRSTIIESIVSAWNYVSDDLIKKSFKITGLTQCPYGSEKNQLYKPLLDLVYNRGVQPLKKQDLEDIEMNDVRNEEKDNDSDEEYFDDLE